MRLRIPIAAFRGDEARGEVLAHPESREARRSCPRRFALNVTPDHTVAGLGELTALLA